MTDRRALCGSGTLYGAWIEICLDPPMMSVVFLSLSSAGLVVNRRWVTQK